MVILLVDVTPFSVHEMSEFLSPRVVRALYAHVLYPSGH